MMATALTLLSEREIRTLHLYDTFEGMPPPSSIDRAIKSNGKLASAILQEADKLSVFWGYAALDEVRTNLLSTVYPGDRIHFHKGKVEDTIPETAPETISVLRLDIDLVRVYKMGIDASLSPAFCWRCINHG
jgi:hypothetical protein